MKRFLLLLFIIASIDCLSGCCDTSQLGCGSCTKFMSTGCRLSQQSCPRNKCNACNTTGYDTNYNYSGWY